MASVVDLDTGMRWFWERGRASGISRDGRTALVQYECDSGMSTVEAFGLQTIDVKTAETDVAPNVIPDGCGASWSY
jgi:hypothetical protein